MCPSVARSQQRVPVPLCGTGWTNAEIAGASLNETDMNLKNAVKPRMDKDGHGYQGVALAVGFIRRVNVKRNFRSVFIRVYPWFRIPLSHANCGI